MNARFRIEYLILSQPLYMHGLHGHRVHGDLITSDQVSKPTFLIMTIIHGFKAASGTAQAHLLACNCCHPAQRAIHLIHELRTRIDAM